MDWFKDDMFLLIIFIIFKLFNFIINNFIYFKYLLLAGTAYFLFVYLKKFNIIGLIKICRMRFILFVVITKFFIVYLFFLFFFNKKQLIFFLGGDIRIYFVNAKI